MLSYRHAFHAGNFADVLKHSVLTAILDHLAKKDAPFEYIDTHAGAGLYDLSGGEATKLREHADGVARLDPQDWPDLARYLEVIARFNPQGSLRYYPGSPLIAADFLRDRDRAWLFERHPQDLLALQANTSRERRIRVSDQDGYRGLLGLVPPTARRGLVLIDPSYELKTDYRQVFETIQAAHRKFSTGVYALWYPVVDRTRIDRLWNDFRRSGIRRIAVFELGVREGPPNSGMHAAGMLVINPPWTLNDAMGALLPRLVEALAQDEGAFTLCKELVGE